MMQQYPESATWLTMAMVHARASAKPRMRENRRDDDFAAACACRRAPRARDRRARRVRAVSPRGVRGVRVAPRHRSPRRDGMPTVRRGDADAARPDTRAAREGRVSREVASPPPRRQSRRRRGFRFDDRSEGFRSPRRFDDRSEGFGNVE